MPLLTSADLDQPYAAADRASEAIAAAESRVYSALASSSRGYTIPDDLSTWETGTVAEQRLYAEVVQLIRDLAQGTLSFGRAGASKRVLRRETEAIRRLKEIRDGADLGLPRDRAPGAALELVGPTGEEQAAPCLGRLWGQRKVGV